MRWLKSIGKKTLGVGVLVLFFLAISPVYGTSDDDWPMFQHDPQHTGYTDCEMPDELELLWKFETEDSIHSSSPAVVNGKVYIGSHDGYIYCLDATTGEVVWKYEIGNYVSSFPAVVNGKVYIGYDALYCLDADTGKLIWKYETKWKWDMMHSPVVSSRKVYVGSDSCYIYCFNADTGELIWQYEIGDYVGSPTISKDKIYVGSSDYYLYCFDTDTGKLIWKYKTEGSVNSSPSVANGKLYVGAEYYLYCLNAHTGRVIWKYKTGSWVQSSPAIVNGKIYFGSNDKYLYCFGKKKEIPPLATTPKPTTPAPTTAPPSTSPPTTSVPTTTAPSSTEGSNTLLYLGIFAAVIICILAIYQITKKKPEKKVEVPEKLSKKEIEKLRRKLDEDYAEGKISREEYLKRKKELKDQRKIF